jgi:hypothetical protein
VVARVHARRETSQRYQTAAARKTHPSKCSTAKNETCACVRAANTRGCHLYLQPDGPQVSFVSAAHKSLKVQLTGCSRTVSRCCKCARMHLQGRQQQGASFVCFSAVRATHTIMHPGEA